MSDKKRVVSTRTATYGDGNVEEERLWALLDLCERRGSAGLERWHVLSC